MAIRYKVVRPGRKSCWVNSRYTLIYEKDTIVNPKGTKVFVFSRRCDAEYFIGEAKANGYGGGWKILRVEGIGRGIKLKSRPTYYGPSVIEVFWKFFDIILKDMRKGNTSTTAAYGDPLKSLDDGTMLYDAVKVID